VIYYGYNPAGTGVSSGLGVFIMPGREVAVWVGVSVLLGVGVGVSVEGGTAVWVGDGVNV
jgi:hypothetical protein